MKDLQTNCNLPIGGNMKMRKILVTIFTVFLLSGCEEEEKLEVRNAELINYGIMEDRESFMTVIFKLESGEEKEFSAHIVYEDKFKDSEGETFDFLYDKKDFMRPDNEIVSLNPFDGYNPYKR
jgi:Prokaryotic membrane lipoprotein lipid attachment site